MQKKLGEYTNYKKRGESVISKYIGKSNKGKEENET